ncbi:MAG: acyl carrier protein [Myxococcales bacterium]|nr:acyl carrier protein [Myxococcales bacterium]
MAKELDRAAVAEVLEAVLGVAVSRTEDTRRQGLAAWDSVKHIEVVFALEDTFEVEISEAVVATLDSVDAIVRALGGLRAA